MIQIQITETGCPSPSKSEESFIIDKIEENFQNLELAREFLKEKYKTIGKNKIYQDFKDGTTKEVGFLKSYWEKEYDKLYWKTDWVSIYEVTETQIILSKL